MSNNKVRCPIETGTMTINGHKMTWSFKRTKGECASGIRASRIFYLQLHKDGELVGDYDMGWSKKIFDEDEESSLCLTYLPDRFGREVKKKGKKDV